MKVVYRLALIFCSLFVVLIVAEVGLRIRENGQRRKILAGRTAADLGTIRADPPLLYSLKPGWHGQFNSHGFRDVERTIEKPDGAWRMAVVGDSVTMQLTIRRDKLYVSHLEKILQEAYPEAGIECPSFGVTGYCATQALALMRGTVLDFDPNAILWQFHLNDAVDPVIDGANGGLGRYYARPFSQIWASLRRRANHLLREIVIQRRYPGLKQPDLKLQAWYWDETGKIIDELRQLSAARKIPIFVVLFPSFPEGGDWERYSRADMRLYGALVSRFEAAGFPVLDLMPVFQRRPISELQREPGDLWHPSKRGHRVMARAISRWLIEEQLPVP